MDVLINNETNLTVIPVEIWETICSFIPFEWTEQTSTKQISTEQTSVPTKLINTWLSVKLTCMSFYHISRRIFSPFRASKKALCYFLKNTTIENFREALEMAKYVVHGEEIQLSEYLMEESLENNDELIFITLAKYDFKNFQAICKKKYENVFGKKKKFGDKLLSVAKQKSKTRICEMLEKLDYKPFKVVLCGIDPDTPWRNAMQNSSHFGNRYRQQQNKSISNLRFQPYQSPNNNTEISRYYYNNYKIL